MADERVMGSEAFDFSRGRLKRFDRRSCWRTFGSQSDEGSRRLNNKFNARFNCSTRCVEKLIALSDAINTFATDETFS